MCAMDVFKNIRRSFLLQMDICYVKPRSSISGGLVVYPENLAVLLFAVHLQ